MVMTEFNVQHQMEENRFVIELPNDQSAQLLYTQTDHHNDPSSKSVVDFYRTFVPDRFRGKGLAAMLVDEGLNWAENNDLQIEASCWYAQSRIEKRGQNVQDPAKR
jgi:predicted GNAT family acetyltransferase